MLIGQGGTITAVVKVLGLALLVVCMLRYGVRLDRFNPSFAFLFMFVVGLAHGLWPTLTVMDSVRSLLGSVRAVRLLVLAAVAALVQCDHQRHHLGAVVHRRLRRAAGAGACAPAVHQRGRRAAAGRVRPHPAFLGGFAAAAIYAAWSSCTATDARAISGRSSINYVILALSGARAPLAGALVVTAVAFFFLRSEPFPARRRLPMVLLGMLALPVLVAVATGSSGIRLLNVLSSNAQSLSGRDLIWPMFERAWDASPVFGWGIGAGKIVIDPD